jgi:hypothetical protein
VACYEGDILRPRRCLKIAARAGILDSLKFGRALADARKAEAACIAVFDCLVNVLNRLFFGGKLGLCRHPKHD